MEQTGDMAAKLNQYREQLGQVQEMLRGDPLNGQLLGIEINLKEAISMTSQLVEAGQAPFKPQNDDEEKSLEEDEEKKESDNLPQEEEIESPKDNSDFIGSLKLGNIVEGLWSGRWYPGVVERLEEDLTTVSLSFYNYESEVVQLLADDVRRIEMVGEEVTREELKSEEKNSYEAKYEDGKWYEVEVDSVTDRGVRVTFSSYDLVSEVPLVYVRRKVDLVKKKRKVEEAQETDKPPTTTSNEPVMDPTKEFEVPERLKYLPTDTASQRQRKKKRVKSLKNQHRIEQQNLEGRDKMDDWQKFLGKGKKRAKGFMTNKRGGSIFSVGDGFNSKVGVTGSGGQLTETRSRKRHQNQF